MQTFFDYFPFLLRVRFWLALVTLVIAFGPRFGIVLNANEIAAMNVLILAAFGMEGEVKQSIVNIQAMRAYRSLLREQTP